MVHKIEFSIRNSVIDCFLPKDSVPDNHPDAGFSQGCGHSDWNRDDDDRYCGSPGHGKRYQLRHAVLYIQDNKDVVYDIEMQVSDTGELPKRSRYYQSMIDLQLIDKGQFYGELNRSYIIFICPFDTFGKERHIYTFENICKEDGSISMGDEAVKIFLNANGTQDDISKELKAFLDYVAGKKSEDSYVEKLDEAVKEAKRNREWRHEYMTLLMRDQANVKKGEEMLAKLIKMLYEDNRLSDIVKVSQDKEYRQKLYVEYHII